MKKTLFNLLVLGMVCFFSCKSIIEEDLEGKKVIINTPNAAELDSYSQTFWWEPLDGVLKYQVQIVSPSFDTIQQLITDTLVTGTKLTRSLDPGRYEWRIRGINGSYKSDYNGSKFRILVGDFTKQFVTLLTPYDNGFSSLTPMKLYWDDLYGADNYRIQIDKTNSFTTGIILNNTTPNTNYTFTLTDETIYYWRVKAYKGADSSLWSGINSFTYDVTVPDPVVLKTPANNLTDLNAASGSLTWNSSGTGMKYIVYIQYGTATEIPSAQITSTSYPYSGTSGQVVKWRVEAVDAAGNKGTTSPQWQFKIQ